jgi:hypothetical protein
LRSRAFPNAEVQQDRTTSRPIETDTVQKIVKQCVSIRSHFICNKVQQPSFVDVHLFGSEMLLDLLQYGHLNSFSQLSAIGKLLEKRLSGNHNLIREKGRIRNRPFGEGHTFVQPIKSVAARIEA